MRLVPLGRVGMYLARTETETETETEIETETETETSNQLKSRPKILDHHCM
jgi:hypothetical protein